MRDDTNPHGSPFVSPDSVSGVTRAGWSALGTWSTADSPQDARAASEFDPSEPHTLRAATS